MNLRQMVQKLLGTQIHGHDNATGLSFRTTD